jgi:hypothetical protein
MSDPSARLITINKQKKGSQNMTYTIRLETFNGSVKNIALPSKGAVAQFVSTYADTLPVGVSVKFACDTLAISGTLRGKAVL